MEGVPQNRKQPVAIIVLAAIAGFATAALGGRAWWALPPALFIGFVVLMQTTRRQYLSVGWVLVAAAVAGALGVLLKFT